MTYTYILLRTAFHKSKSKIAQVAYKEITNIKISQSFCLSYFCLLSQRQMRHSLSACIITQGPLIILFVDDNNNRWSCIAVTCLNLRHHLNRELTCLIRTINRPRTFHVFVPQWKGMVNKWSCSMTVPPTHPVTCHKGQLCHEDHSIVSWHPPPTSSTNQKKAAWRQQTKKFCITDPPNVAQYYVTLYAYHFEQLLS